MSLLLPYPASFCLFSPHSPSLSKAPTPSFPKTLIPIPFPSPLLRRRCCRRRQPTAVHASDEDLLRALTSSPDGADNSRGPHHLPAVRSYETDLARLALMGSVGFDQALTAAAADGGDAAEEHLAAGTNAMVVETVFPGSSGEHSTVSTRLFLPARKVKEKAKKLSKSFASEIHSSSATLSKNILAMTFRQVVLHRLWSFKLSVFCPGTERNMEDLANHREVPAEFSMDSSDERLLSALSEVVCLCALECNVRGLPSKKMLGWFQKSERISSVDSSISVYKIAEEEKVKNARNQVGKYKLAKGEYMNRKRKFKQWWEPTKYLNLDKVGGPGFSAWVNEFVPAYKLQIDVSIFKDAKLEGGRELVGNRWEALLTHFQMVELANILDMYYEDQYTMPNKQLSSGSMTESLVISRNKSSSWKLLFFIVASGSILIFASVLAQLCWPNHLRARKAPEQNSLLSLSEIDCSYLQSLEATELEALCISIVQKIKDELGWTGDLMFDTKVGAWTGVVPSFLRNTDTVLNAVSGCRETAANEDAQTQTHEAPITSEAAQLGAKDMAIETTAQSIASYQVVMSDGKIVGFQPTSRVAVNHWASNPLAKVLYGGKKLSPDLLEPGLKIPCPHKVVVMELLMSVDPGSQFALVRQMQT